MLSFSSLSYGLKSVPTDTYLNADKNSVIKPLPYNINYH